MGLPAPTGRAFRFGVFEIDLDGYELRKRGLRVKLARQPFEILGAVIERRGEVVTREELRQRLWPDQPCGDHDHSLNKAVNKIREALGDSADSPRYLETVPRVGYRLLVLLEPLSERAKTDEIGPPVEAEALPPKARPWRLYAAAGLAFVAALSAAVFIRLGPDHAANATRSLAPAPLTTYLGSEYAPSFSSDGDMVAFVWDGEAQDNPDIYVVGLDGGPARRLTRDPRADSSPAWSPDGRLIAFYRSAGEGKVEVRLISPEGGEERLLAAIGQVPQAGLAWSSDSKWLVIPDADDRSGYPHLALLSVRDGQRRDLTSPSPGTLGDGAPAISRDGRILAFARAVNPAWKEIFVASLTADLRLAAPPRKITDFHKDIGSLVWTANGQELLFSAGGAPSGPKFLYRINAHAPGPVEDLAGVRIEGSFPALSPDGRKLAYARNNLEQISVWKLDIRSGVRSRLIGTSVQDFNADFSPNMQRIVFRSNRSGSPELWVSGIDGSTPRRITFLGDNGASAPRWSPNGRQVAFESRSQGASDIYVIEMDTGTMRRITADPADDYLPNWSRDGREIYFCSTRSGEPEVWRVPAIGGTPVQITRRGGIYAVEAPDRKTLYFTTPGSPAKLRRVPMEGGRELDVADNLVGLSGLAAAPQGLYYLGIPDHSASGVIRFLDLASMSNRLVTVLSTPLHHGISVSSDGQQLLYSAVERRGSDLALIENFH